MGGFRNSNNNGRTFYLSVNGNGKNKKKVSLSISILIPDNCLATGESIIMVLPDILIV